MIDWLADTLLATSLLMALVLLVREPVRRQFGPAAANGLWLVPALRRVMPPLTQTVERIVPAGKPVAAASAPFEQAAFLPAAEPSLVDRLGGWETLALSAWLAGVLVMLIGGLFIYRWQRREVLRDSIQLARLGKIRIVRSAAVHGPMAFGIVDKVIALPIDFENRYDPEERRLAFDHELAHHRSGDLLVSHVAFALLCLQWFNPLAWLSHAAFRFDQEAACDARVLDKASGSNRAAYAQAIAKAASGRALLFAGALDRPRTLHRRLQSMLTTPSNGRRFAGKALIAATAAAALPLTASHATDYVDVPAPAAPAPVAAIASAAAPAPAPVQALSPAAAVAPVTPASAAAPEPAYRENPNGTVTLSGGVILDKGSTAFFANDNVLIDGKVKSLDQLTPAERTRLRTAILKSQQDLARERAELPRRLAEARRELERARSGLMKRDYQRDIEDMRRDLAEIDSEAAEMRAAGEDPAKRKAEIERDLREAQSVDIDKEIREAIEDSDPAKITAELRSAEQQMKRMLARLDQLEGR
jgi:beta-lactamase regulating signal transducer with metallopeptidase domain